MTRLSLPPTRITPTSKTSIDCVCTNLDHEYLNVTIINTAISDHTAQLCTIRNIMKHKDQSLTSENRILSSRNIMNMGSLLDLQDWKIVLESVSVDESYENFCKILTNALDITCPVTKSKRKRTKQKVSADRETVQLKNIFLEAFDKYNLTGREEDKNDAMAKKKAYDMKLRTVKRLEVAKSIALSNDKPKTLWKIINNERKMGERKMLPTTLHIEGREVNEPAAVANHLNDHFVMIADNTLKQNGQINTTFPVPQNQHHNIPSLFLHPTTEQEVISVINTFKAKPSAGVDGISAKIVKACKEQIQLPLTDIANKSFAQGKFPELLKVAKVYPKFKKGDVTDANNYRPISLISTFSKVIEKLVLARLLQHLYQHNLLNNKQHGFMAGKSTSTAIVDLVETIIDHLESDNIPMAILLDYSKAFDCLDHNQLLGKLKNLGIEGKAADWFESYLLNRKQIVEIKHMDKGTIQSVKSKTQTTTRGVPQGSVLGPVILFTNDFSSCVTKPLTKTLNPLKTGSQLHTYNTRHATNYCLPVHRLTKYEEKPSYMGSKLWNHLPAAVKGTDDQHLRQRLVYLQCLPVFDVFPPPGFSAGITKPESRFAEQFSGKTWHARLG
ncbi:uncharacterized protein LOC124371752, partial [Homalodisca vitripennis]|uniref:uncharacterized protein LOC124371752 n=1 Tax=Homalodisca vitripennis TaxID=197043 RepID=UPI001EEA0E0F